VLSNKDLEEMVDTTDEWIRTRTGILERRIAADDQPTSALAAEAGLNALAAADISPEDLDAIIVGTVTPDEQFPNAGCFVQNRIGAWNAASFSLEAACSGFIYGLEVATSLIQSGRFDRILVIGAEKLSTIVDWEDRSTCVLFGDGAGAMILEAAPPEEHQFLGSVIGSDGRYTQLLHVPGGGSAMPLSPEVLENREHYLKMNGPEIFKLAVNNMVKAARRVMEEAGITIEQVRWLVPHQANMRIISSIAKRLGVTEENCYINLQRTGNTSAATIPIAIDELVQKDLLKKGDYLLTVAFGGGLTYGSNLIKWR
jgi:3-oxoacyl-[acyl-carrier-protein] synthase-3